MKHQQLVTDLEARITDIDKKMQSLANAGYDAVMRREFYSADNIYSGMDFLKKQRGDVAELLADFTGRSFND